jgi:hypothetical protein
MAGVYPTSAGTWSTRTWNDDSTGAAYGPGSPQPGDTVYSNNFSITIDVDITVVALSTRPGTTAAAGGGFSAGTGRTINADTYAGTTTCLILSGTAVQNGDSYGSNSTNSRYGTILQAGSAQVGNAYGGNGSSRHGTNIPGVASLTGDSFGGSAFGAHGVNISNGGYQIGDSTGGSASSANGTNLSTQSYQIGNSYGGSAAGASGSYVSSNGILITDSVTDNTGDAVTIATTAAMVLLFGGLTTGDLHGSAPIELTQSSYPVQPTKLFWEPKYVSSGGASESVTVYVG